MAPVKFDDISKTANSVLSDDYQEKGFVLKTKQKTSWDGAVVSSQVDLFGKDAVQTPAKLTWKLPTPFGKSFVCVDKLELDKAGKMKLECSIADGTVSVNDSKVGDLKVEIKSDLVDPAKVTAHCTYTGLKGYQVKLDAPPKDPMSFTAEVTYANGPYTVGAKCTSKTLTAPDLGVHFLKGPYFCSLIVKDKLAVYTAHGFYRASDKLKCAATYAHGGKSSGNCSLGLFYELMKGTTVKAKVAQDQSVSCSVKHEVSKGFTLIGGGKYDTKKGDYTYGLQLSVE
jgi:hypothetical protein